MHTLRTRGTVPDDRLEQLQSFVAGQTTTEQVFRDLDQRGLRIADIIAMDEYTLDLVVPLPGGLVLVYDST